LKAKTGAYDIKYLQFSLCGVSIMDQKNLLWDGWSVDLDQVIKEARLTALQRVQERLTKGMESLLMEEAIKRLAGPVVLEKTEALEEKNDPSLIYLFGIASLDAEEAILRNNLTGMAKDEQVYPVLHRELIAVVSNVPRTEFSETKIRDLAENRDWLEEKNKQHQEVISRLAEEYPVIPMGFSTLYPSEEQLKLFLEENYHDLMNLLEKIRDKREWHVKIFLNEGMYKEFLRERDDSIKKLMDEMSLNQAGKGYLWQKRLANRIERKAFDLAEEVHRRLCRFSSGAVLNKLQPQAVTGRKERMILNGAYLLETGQKESFFQTVNILKETEGPRGFVIEISGPGPCYNFCKISSAST